MDTLISEDQATPPRSSLGRLLAVVGSCCLFAPLVGVSITIFSIIRSFGEMSQSVPATDPGFVSQPIGEALVATAIGFGIGVLGIGLVCVAIFGFRFKPPWLRNTLITALVLWLPAFPVGTVVGVVALVVLIRKRQVFDGRRRGN